jgi:formylglycine-generating enzyme required for sulfatase activity
LPSDAEWEYAARAGTTTPYFWGDDRDLGCGYANGCDQRMKRAMPPSYPAIYAACDDGAVTTTPSGHYLPNAFGLHDMIGNVWEWVSDCTENTYETLPTNGSPRTADGCPTRDVRGGSWNDDPEDLRSATRHRVAPATREYDLGFRVARSM